MLPSLEIKNFRTFKHLTIEKLAQINLITGKNNVGKTTLLEAINFYGHNGSPHVIRNVIQNFQYADFFKYLYNDYNIKNSIEIGYKNDINNYLKFDIVVDPINTIDISIQRTYNGKPLYKDIKIAPHTLSDIKLQIQGTSDIETRCFYVPSSGMQIEKLCESWNNLLLTPLMDDVIKGLQLLSSSIQQIALKSVSNGKNNQIFFVKKKDIEHPISMDSLGDGIIRDFEIILSMVSAKDGTLLIDEVENGLHFSVQPHVWKLIFELAKRLNVQVFATTHSWDCICAYQEACSEYEDVDSQLIRLTRKNDKILTSIMNRKDLAIVTRDHIEVR